jgi:hypothetical protein
MKELRAWGVGDYDTSDDAHATWLRRGADILRIEAIDPGQLELHGLTIFRRDAEGNLIAKIDAARAVFQDGSWTLYDVARSQVASATVDKVEHMLWSGDVVSGDLDLLVTGLAEMLFRELLRVVDDPELERKYRLFLAPGMGHCAGGNGPNQFDALKALDAWVETGKPPDSIIATRMKDGVADRTRPLCPYPQVARYKGQGSIDDAANFSCVAPR